MSCCGPPSVGICTPGPQGPQGPTGPTGPAGGGTGGNLSVSVSGNTAGIPALITGGLLALAGGPGVTLSQNASTISISAAQSTQTQPAGAIAGTGITTTTQAGSTLGASLGTNGLSLGIPQWITGGIDASIGGNVSGAPALISTGTLFLAGGNNVTLSQAGNSITISANTAAAATLSISAGSTSGAFNGITLSNSNNVSFGLNNGTITASASFNQAPVAVSGSNGSFAYTTLSLGALNGLTFYTSNGSAVGSYNSTQFAGSGTTFGGTNVSGSMTLNSAGLALSLSGPNESGVALSAAGSSQSAGTMVLSNSNGVSFGMNGSTVTASYNSTQFAGSGTTFSGTNISGSMTLNSAGLNLALSGVAGGSGASTGGIYADGNTTGQSSSSTYPQSSLNVSFAGIISGGWSSNSLIISAPGTTGLTQLSAGMSTGGNTAGTTGLASAQLVLAGGNNVTLSGSTNAGSMTISIAGAAAGGIDVTLAGNTTGTLALVSSGTMTLAGGNNITLSQNGNAITISGGVGGGASTVGAYALGNTTQNSSTTLNQSALSFNALGAMTWGYSNGSIQVSAPATSSISGTGLVSVSVNGSTISIGANALTAYAVSNTTQSSSGTVNGTALSIAGAGGVSVGVSNGSVVISGVSGGGVSTAGLYGLGNTTQNSSTTLNLSALSFNGLGEMTIGYSNGSIQLSVPPSSIGVSTGGNTSGNTGTYSGQVVFAGGNNITLSVSSGAGGAQTITISGANAGGAQTGISGLQVSNTTYTSGTVTFQNANGISFGSSGANGISASYTVPSTAGLISAINISAGATSGNLSAVTFSNSNGVSFGLSASTVTASVAAQSNQTVGLYAVGNTTQNSSTTLDARTLSFDALGAMTAGFSNGSIQLSAPATSSISGTGLVSISVNGSTISIGAAAAQLSFFNALPQAVTTLTQIGQGSVQIYPIFDLEAFSASRADLLISNSVSSSSNSSHAGAISLNIGIYTRNGSTLSLASSGSQSYQWTNTSNNSMASIASLRRLSVPLNVNYSGGDAWLAIMSQTTSTGNNWFTASNIVVQPQMTGQLQGLIGQASANSNQIMLGSGLWSTTSAALPASIGFSQISGLGSNGAGANVYMAPVQFANFTA